MIDEKDFILKEYARPNGKTIRQYWFMYYCDNCGVKRSYAPKGRSGLCRPCGCLGRKISKEQRASISKTLMGRKIGKRGDDLSNARKGASLMHISLEEYLAGKPMRDALRRCKKNMLDRLVRFVKKERRTFEFVEFTSENLRNHLESLWQSGMSWDNYGRKKNIQCWEIDHIIPLRYKTPDGLYYWNQEGLMDPSSETFKKAWSLDNLQPMWARLNWSKQNRRIGL